MQDDHNRYAHGWSRRQIQIRSSNVQSYEIQNLFVQRLRINEKEVVVEYNII